jgi:hypothetical protein
VIVLHTDGTGVGVVVLDGLKARKGIRRNAYLCVCNERGRSRVYGYRFHPHDSAGLFSSRNIYVDGSVGRDVDHRHT